MRIKVTIPQGANKFADFVSKDNTRPSLRYAAIDIDDNYIAASDTNILGLFDLTDMEIIEESDKEREERKDWTILLEPNLLAKIAGRVVEIETREETREQIEKTKSGKELSHKFYVIKYGITWDGGEETWETPKMRFPKCRRVIPPREKLTSRFAFPTNDKESVSKFAKNVFDKDFCNNLIIAEDNEICLSVEDDFRHIFVNCTGETEGVATHGVVHTHNFAKMLDASTDGFIYSSVKFGYSTVNAGDMQLVYMFATPPEIEAPKLTPGRLKYTVQDIAQKLADKAREIWAKITLTERGRKVFKPGNHTAKQVHKALTLDLIYKTTGEAEIIIENESAKVIISADRIFEELGRWECFLAPKDRPRFGIDADRVKKINYIKITSKGITEQKGVQVVNVDGIYYTPTKKNKGGYVSVIAEINGKYLEFTNMGLPDVVGNIDKFRARYHKSAGEIIEYIAKQIEEQPEFAGVCVDALEYLGQPVMQTI